MKLVLPALLILSVAFGSQKHQETAAPGLSVPEKEGRNGQPPSPTVAAPLPSIPDPSQPFRTADPQRQGRRVPTAAERAARKQEALRWAIHSSKEDVVQRLLADHNFDPSFNENEAIRMACKLGDRHRIVKLLLARREVNPAARDNEALREAAFRGDEGTVMALLESGRVDPAARDSEALRSLMSKGSAINLATLVRLMLTYPGVNPAANDNYAIMLAPDANNIEVLRVLLADERVDPGARGNAALMMSVHSRNYAAFTELLANPKVDPGVSTFDVLHLIIVEQERADFLEAFLRHPRVRSRADFAAVQSFAMELTIASSSTVCAAVFGTLKYPRTILEWAVWTKRAGRREMIDFLLSDGLRVDASELLSVAAARGEAWIVERCLKHPGIALGPFYTQAMEAAERNGHQAVAEMLQAHKATTVASTGPAQNSGRPADVPPLPASSSSALRPPPPSTRIRDLSDTSVPASSRLVPLPPVPVFTPGLPANPPPVPMPTQPGTQHRHIGEMAKALGDAPAAFASARNEAQPATAKRVPRRKAVSKERDGKPEAPKVKLDSRKRKVAQDNSDAATQRLRVPRPISVQERMEQAAKRRKLEEAEKAETAAMEVGSQAQNGAAFDYLVVAATEAATEKK